MIPEFFRDYSRFIEEYNQLKTNCVRDKKHVNDIEHHIKWGGRIGQNELHRPERKMRQNAVMTCISYNYVSSSLLDVLS